MTVLIVSDSKGNAFVKQQFDSHAAAVKWLSEEQTRKYWDPNNTWQFIDTPDDKPTTQEIDAARIKGESQDAARARLVDAAAIISADKALSDETKNVILDLIQVSL